VSKAGFCAIATIACATYSNYANGTHATAQISDGMFKVLDLPSRILID
jgi:hypothetical protein